MIHYFIGLMLASGANTDSGVAIVDRNNEIIFLDKLYTMNDIQYFFDNFSSLKNSQICISLPSDNTMLNGKWRVFSKLYQLIDINGNFINTDNWTQRFSKRGCEYFSSLVENDIKINRFDINLTRADMKLNSYFKDRSPADCKALQLALKLERGFTSLPTNMMPMAQLEAIVGAVLAKEIADRNENNRENLKTIFEFEGIPVIR